MGIDRKDEISFNLMELTQLFCLNLIPSNENTKIMSWLETIRILCMASTETSKNLINWDDIKMMSCLETMLKLIHIIHG